MATFTEKEIRECLADTGVAATVTAFASAEKGEEQEAAELVMRTLASALTDPLDLEHPEGYGKYVADALAEDVPGEDMRTDAAAHWLPSLHREMVVRQIVKHALACNVMDERDWIADQEQAYKDEQGDRAYDEARIEGRRPHRG